MFLEGIPATTLPWLKQLSVSETSERVGDFNLYLKLCDLIQTVYYTRSKAIQYLSDISITHEKDYINIKKKLLSNGAKSFQNYHQSVFSLYLLSAYSEASQLIESNFKECHKTIYNRINSIKAT